MLRKLRRSVARTAMKDKGIKMFGNYIPSTVIVKNKRTGKMEEHETSRSVFAVRWREYL